ncbi:MAG: glutamate racemase [Eubacteriales bacterium]|nr:glutamate racemase [Eubacteriales bacterium]
MADNRPIGVMDSGFGGMSTLKTLRETLPRESFVFWGDNAHAPYGVHTAREIQDYTMEVVRRLLEKDVKAIVIACNTATSAAAASLREQLSLPVLGLEPALKPAVEYAGDGLVAVLATPATLKLEKYQQLSQKYGRNTVNVPCPELVELVEAGQTDTPQVRACIEEKLSAYRERLKAVVLGCTHFVWLRDAVQRAVPGVRIFDGNQGLALHLIDVLQTNRLETAAEHGVCEYHTTSQDPEILRRLEDFARRVEG